jgi:hypothetical protein
MTPQGQKAFSLKTESRSKIYAHEKAVVDLNPVYEKQFKRQLGTFLMHKPLPIKR